jgi:hypothetical protein
MAILSTLRPFGLFYGHFGNLVMIWYIFLRFWYSRYTNKNLATLMPSRNGFAALRNNGEVKLAESQNVEKISKMYNVEKNRKVKKSKKYRKCIINLPLLTVTRRGYVEGDILLVLD